MASEPRRQDLYDSTQEGDEAHAARCRHDQAEALARGWTHVHVVHWAEPPVPVGVPPEGDPRRAWSDETGIGHPLPDYGAGEDGGYQHVPLSPGAPEP